MPLKPNKILLAKSPQFIVYNRDITYTYIRVYLKLWNGLFTDFPDDATHTYTIYKINNLAFLNIQQPLNDFLNPTLNTTFFDSDAPDDFGEFANFKYKIEVFNAETLVDEIISDNYLVCLGYGRYSDGANPKLKVIPSESVVTIDSDLISIDSTLFTIDSEGNKILFENKHKYHSNNTCVFDGFLNAAATGSSNVIIRSLTDKFKASCSGVYDSKQVIYRDKNGLFDTFSFTKASSYSVKSIIESSSRLNATPYAYNLAEHNQKTTKTGVVKHTFNTDNLTEINGEYLKDLFFSDIYYLVDYTAKTFIPLVLTDTDFTPKTDIKDRGKQQYTFKFEEAGTYIQKIR